MHFGPIRSLFIHRLVKSAILTTIKLAQTADKTDTQKLRT